MILRIIIIEILKDNLKAIVSVLALLCATTTFASDNWTCTETSSYATDNVLHACGVGQGPDEDTARAQAFEHAKDEFARVCANHTDCSYREVAVNPKRTTCDETHGQWKCYRMVEFSVGNLNRYGIKITQAPIKKYAPLEVGMTPKQVIRHLGQPTQFHNYEALGMATMEFQGDMCVAASCVVEFEDGKLVSYSLFR